MRFKIQVVIEDDDEITTVEDIIAFDKGIGDIACIGLTLKESKQLLKQLQCLIIQTQAQTYVNTHRLCPHCAKKLRIKGHHSLQYRTLFGIVTLDSPRFYQCHCSSAKGSTFSLLKPWLPEHISPELKYIETKWASLMAYGLTAELMKDILPVGITLNASTVKNHVHEVAARMERDLKEKPEPYIGCGYDWAATPETRQAINCRH